METTQRFRETDIAFAGIAGEDVEVGSANPENYYQAIADPTGCEAITIDGKLFVEPGVSSAPAVIVVPGSLGVGPNHLAHAETLFGEGYAVLVLDPFGQRLVQSTVANQTQYSFAASAFDVLAALKLLCDHPAIDGGRVTAQGHSRGGSAVLTAATRRFADPIVGSGIGLAGVYAVYPWCGHQFANPSVGSTRVRAIVGDQDDWVSVQQVQGQVHAVGLTGAEASVRIVSGAAHSFDRLEPVHELAEASVTPAAPTVMIADDGAMIHPFTGESDAALTDRDLFILAVDGGHGRMGARIGGVGDQPAVFRDDMLKFHRSVLDPS